MARIAKESNAVQRSRRKLEAKLKDNHEKVNSTALLEMKNLIRHWIRRHEEERVPLKERVALFDENVHSAKTESLYVKELLRKLSGSEGSDNDKLKGRVSR